MMSALSVLNWINIVGVIDVAIIRWRSNKNM